MNERFPSRATEGPQRPDEREGDDELDERDEDEGPEEGGHDVLVAADAAAIFVRRRDDAGDLARAGALVRQDVVALRRVARVPLAQQPLRAVVDGVAGQVPARVVHTVDVAHLAHTSLLLPDNVLSYSTPPMKQSVYLRSIDGTVIKARTDRDTGSVEPGLRPIFGSESGSENQF